MGDKAQKARTRAIKDFARFLKRSPDTATTYDLHAYQLHMNDTEVRCPNTSLDGLTLAKYGNRSQ